MVTLRVPAGTVPDVDSRQSEVVFPRSAGVTGPRLAEPRSRDEPSRNCAIISASSFCEEYPTRNPHSVYGIVPASIPAAKPETSIVWDRVEKDAAVDPPV